MLFRRSVETDVDAVEFGRFFGQQPFAALLLGDVGMGCDPAAVRQRLALD